MLKWLIAHKLIALGLLSSPLALVIAAKKRAKAPAGPQGHVVTKQMQEAYRASHSPLGGLIHPDTNGLQAFYGDNRQDIAQRLKPTAGGRGDQNIDAVLAARQDRNAKTLALARKKLGLNPDGTKPQPPGAPGAAPGPVQAHAQTTVDRTPTSAAPPRPAGTVGNTPIPTHRSSALQLKRGVRG